MLKMFNCFHHDHDWDQIVGSNTDPQLSSAFYRAFGGGQLVHYEADGKYIAKPFRHQEDNWIGNAYNYGGILGSEELLPELTKEFDQWKDHHSLNERYCLNPFYSYRPPFHIKQTTVNSKRVVYVNLANQYKLRPTTRRCIQKAETSGVSIELVDPGIVTVGIFDTIYHDEMCEKGAASHWFYKNRFFYDVVTELGPKRSALFLGKVGKRVDGGALIIYDNNICYYHWATANRRARETCLSHLLVWTVIQWAKNKGMKFVHLGGGVKEGDGLETFKQGFSKDTIACFSYVTTAGVSNG